LYICGENRPYKLIDTTHILDIIISRTCRCPEKGRERETRKSECGPAAVWADESYQKTIAGKRREGVASRTMPEPEDLPVWRK